MKIIDCHYHNHYWMYGDKSYMEIQREYREACEVETLCLLCHSGVSDASPNGGIGQNIMAAILKLEDETIYAQGGLSYPGSGGWRTKLDEDSLKRQAMELMELGFDGMKMLETKPDRYKRLNYRVDSSYYESYFTYLEEHQIPLLWHVADPEEFWEYDKLTENAKKRGWYYGDGSFPMRQDIYGEVLRVLERHPQLQVVFPHFFFQYGNPELIRKLFGWYPNLHIELTPCPEMYRDFQLNRDVWKKFFVQYSDRILFGTDVNGGVELWMKKRLVQDITRFLITEDEFTAFEYYGIDYAYSLKGFGLQEEVTQQILSKNFTRIMGEQPRKIDRLKLKAYIQRYLPELPEGEVKTCIEQYYATKLAKREEELI